MKKSFMTRALAMGLSLAMAFSLSAATNVSVASAAATPAMASKQFAVRVGGAAKSYKASAATQKSFKITKATVGNTDKATVKVNSSKKSIKVTPGTVTGTTVVKVTFKNIKTAKSTAKKYRCVVKAAIEPEKPAEPEVVKATKITDAKVTTAKTMTVTFDGAVDTSSATAIKVMRGSTEAPVTAAYATDSKSVVLTSATPFAAGTYTITVGSFEPATVAVTKQTATKLEILNTTVANTKNAYVGFQVLDQYGEPMENYTGKKLTVEAYNVTKGHKIKDNTTTTKAYFELDCATQDVTNVNGVNVINSIGDDVNVVAYLTDNAGVSTTATLKIANIYMVDLAFGEPELGTDKRVTIGKTYKLPYTVKNNEGNDVKFAEVNTATQGAISRGFGNYTFVTSNVSALDMGDIYVDKDGQMFFTTEMTAGTAVITAINNMTGETTSTTIVVNDVPKMSGLDVADTSIAWDTKNSDNTTPVEIKAAVTVYDQFGEVVDPKNIRNAKIAGDADDFYFSGKTTVPADAGITADRISSDGKYLIYKVDSRSNYVNNRRGRQGQTITFTYISRAAGTNGYVTTSSKVLISDTIEPAALTVVTDPAATVVSGNTIKVKFSVYDQNQNKVALLADPDSTDKWYYQTDFLNSNNVKEKYYVGIENTSNLFSKVERVSNPDTDKLEYELKMTSKLVNAAETDISRAGQFAITLSDSQGRRVTTKSYNLNVIKPIKYFFVSTESKYSAGDKVKVKLDAYSETKTTKLFNRLFNDTVDVQVKLTATNSANNKTYKFSPKFENGSAEVEITAGKADTYTVDVQSLDGKATTITPNPKYTVVGAAASKMVSSKIGVNENQLEMVDSQGNSVGNSEAGSYETYATVSVVDVTNANKDITGKVLMNGTALTLTNNNKVKVQITKTSTQTYISQLDGAAYDATQFAAIVGKECYGVDKHFIKLTLTVGEYSWSTQTQATTAVVEFDTASTLNSDFAKVLIAQTEKDKATFDTKLAAYYTSKSTTEYTGIGGDANSKTANQAIVNKKAYDMNIVSEGALITLAKAVDAEATITVASVGAIATTYTGGTYLMISTCSAANLKAEVQKALIASGYAIGYEVIDVATSGSIVIGTGNTTGTLTITLKNTSTNGYGTVASKSAINVKTKS